MFAQLCTRTIAVGVFRWRTMKSIAKGEVNLSGNRVMVLSAGPRSQGFAGHLLYIACPHIGSPDRLH
jgi:hypothetical protein